MAMQTPIIILSALLALALAGFVGLGYALWRQYQRAGRREQEIQALQKDMHALCNAAVTVGDRMGRLERHLSRLSEKQEELGLRQEQLDRTEPESQSYDQAIKLAHKGASTEELMEICNLTRGEAELIAMMHRLDKAV